MVGNNHYTTSNTALAAYLHYNNLKLLSIEFQDGRGFFVFEASGELDSLIEHFESGKAPEHVYYLSYRYVLDQLAKAK